MADQSSGAAQGPGEAMRRAGERARESGNELSVKLIEQAETNTRAVFSTMRQIAGAGSVGDVMRIQGDFVREQSSRAMEQARELGELLARFGREASAGEQG